MKAWIISLASACLLWTGLRMEAASGAAEWTKFQGMCDASAVEALDNEFFVVGDDEDNILRVYSRFKGGLPIQRLDLTAFLGLRPKAGEVDLEGSSRIGDRIYWITSHGANASGKFDPNRHRFFATRATVSEGKVQLQPVGKPYSNLLHDLSRDPRLARFGLLP